MQHQAVFKLHPVRLPVESPLLVHHTIVWLASGLACTQEMKS